MSKNAAVRNKCWGQGRRIVVVDIENVVRGAVQSELHAAYARQAIEEAIGPTDRDQVVIGTSHVGLVSAGMAWHGARLVVRSGPDGADLALLEVLIGEQIAARFDEVILVSGDGIFADVVSSLGGDGVNVTVAATPGSCSKRLRLAAQGVVRLDFDSASVGQVALVPTRAAGAPLLNYRVS